MISKASVKLIRSLDQKKFRGKYHLFIAEGSKTAHEILNSRLKVHKIYATEGWIAKNNSLIADKEGIELNEVSETELQGISSLTTPQEVLLLVEIPEYDPETEIEGPISLAVENINNPGNLGAIIRICDWYGISRLFCSEDCADAYNPKTVQATMGSIARVAVIYTDLEELISQNKGRKSYAATIDGNLNIHKAAIKAPALLLIGNESHGISGELLDLCDDTVSIPRLGQAESLNASVAAAILVDNLVRMNEG